MTFSIVAYDPEKKEWGVAVQSKFVAVGSIVPWGKANVGVIATQAWVNTSYGPKGLALLEQGLTAEEVLKLLTSQDEKREHRQIGIVDSFGNAIGQRGRHPQQEHPYDALLLDDRDDNDRVEIQAFDLCPHWIHEGVIFYVVDYDGLLGIDGLADFRVFT